MLWKTDADGNLVKINPYPETGKISPEAWAAVEELGRAIEKEERAKNRPLNRHERRRKAARRTTGTGSV